MKTLPNDKKTRFKQVRTITDMTCKFCYSENVTRYGTQNGI